MRGEAVKIITCAWKSNEDYNFCVEKSSKVFTMITFVEKLSNLFLLRGKAIKMITFALKRFQNYNFRIEKLSNIYLLIQNYEQNWTQEVGPHRDTRAKILPKWWHADPFGGKIV